MSETNLDPRDRLAVMVSMAGSYIESGRGDDALAVMRTVAEDVATEIARLTRELEEAREEVAEWVQAAIEHAADLLAERRHGESAPDALMAIRHEVAEWVEAEMALLATPASDGTTRWYCEYGCGCVLDSRAARYHDCRRPASVREAMDYAADHGRITTPEDYADRIREALSTPAAGEGPVIHIPDDAEYRDDGSVHWRVRLPAGAASGEGEAMDADAMWYHWSSGHEVAALQGLRTASDDEAHRFLSMLADWQRCPMPSDHDAAAALRSEAQGEERASKYGALLAFADAISDAVWGGERAWEQDGGLERLSQKVRRWAKERAAHPTTRSESDE